MASFGVPELGSIQYSPRKRSLKESKELLVGFEPITLLKSILVLTTWFVGMGHIQVTASFGWRILITFWF